MQPPRRPTRPIPRELRADPPLVHEKLSDPILVKRAKDGDGRALAALCERHAPRVERLAHHLLRDPEDARDAAQDTLARVCVKLRQFRGESAFTTWLHRLTVNACRDVAQRQLARRHEPLDDDRRQAPDDDPARRAEQSALRRELGTCLAELPPAQAKVVVLKDAFDLTFEEIADAEGLPVGTAKSHAHRGRARLRGELAGRPPA